jgi:hypothetical protein
MHAFWALPVMILAVLVAASEPGLCQRTGWQDQRYATPKAPGRGFTVIREISRQLPDSEIRQPYQPSPRIAGFEIVRGKALLFQSHAESLDGADVIGLVDGKGAHLVITMPPGR